MFREVLGQLRDLLQSSVREAVILALISVKHLYFIMLLSVCVVYRVSFEFTVFS